MKFKQTLPLLIVLFTLLLSGGLKKEVFRLDIQGRHTWRQAQTCINIRNFVRHDFNILNPRSAELNMHENNIRRLEFPLMQWVIAGIQKILGENIFIVRLFLFGLYLLSAIALYKWLTLLFSTELIPALGVFVFSFFPGYLYQSINPLPDNFALCMAIFFLLFFFSGLTSQHTKPLVISAAFLCLAALVKLPFIIYGILPLIFVFKHQWRKKETLAVIIAFGLILIPVGLWYAYAIPQWGGNPVTKGVFDQRVNSEMYLFFLESQLTKNIPNIVIGKWQLLLCFLGLFWIFWKKKYRHPYFAYFLGGILICVLYFLFILKAIGEDHDYYFYPILPFLSVLCLIALQALWKQAKWTKLTCIALILVIPIYSWKEVSGMWDIEKAYFNPDFFIYQDDLRKVVAQEELCIMANDNSLFILPYTVDKRGYIFWDNHLPVDWIRDLSQNRHVKYMYSDSRIIENQEGFKDLVQDTLLVVGSVKVFRFK
jgi:hypothetical protein